MRLVYWLEEHKTKDPLLLQQFETCLLASRMTDQSIAIHVYVPQDFYWPPSWNNLFKIGVTVERTAKQQGELIQPHDILTMGTHCHINRLSQTPIPMAKQFKLDIPDRLVTLPEMAQWCDEQRMAGPKVWFPYSVQPALIFKKPHITELHPLQDWLEFSYWIKCQPNRYPNSQNYHFQRGTWVRRPVLNAF